MSEADPNPNTARVWQVSLLVSVACHLVVFLGVRALVRQGLPLHEDRLIPITLQLERVEDPPPQPRVEVKPAPVPAVASRDPLPPPAVTPVPQPAASVASPPPLPAAVAPPPAPPVTALPTKTSAPVDVAPTVASSGPSPTATVPGPAAGPGVELAQPSYRRNPEPAYPVSARRRRQEGLVVLKVIVTTEGLPRQVAVKQSCGVAALDAAALSAVKGWSFDPGRRQGRAVETEIEVPVRFRLAP